MQNIQHHEFIERYNKSVGLICTEYIGKHLVIYNDEEYCTVNSLSEIKNPNLVTELYIDGLVITTSSRIFWTFTNLKHLYGVPIIKIANLACLFCKCKLLESIPEFGEWDMSQITNMNGLLYQCLRLTNIGDIGEWDVSQVTNMEHMFRDCKLLTSVGDIGRWDTSSVTTMESMFTFCDSLTSVGNLDRWDVSKVRNSMFMFQECNLLTSASVVSKQRKWGEPLYLPLPGCFY